MNTLVEEFAARLIEIRFRNYKESEPVSYVVDVNRNPLKGKVAVISLDKAIGFAPGWHAGDDRFFR